MFLVLAVVGAILIIAFVIGRKIASSFNDGYDDDEDEYIQMPLSPRHHNDALVGFEDIQDRNIVPMMKYESRYYY